MKTAIIYYSKHGTTERVAHLIGEKLSPELEYISLKEFHNPDIQGYDRIILGTSIYAGHPGRLMSKFCNKNRAQLEQKIIALFICGMNDTQEVEQLKKAFPEYLHSNAVAETILGGEFLFDKMNFIEKFITIPLITPLVPSVKIRDGTPITATPQPLNRPIRAPITIPVINATAQFCPSRSILDTTVATNPRFAPTDTSISPINIANAIPADMII